jgi:hypothetical protein
MDLSDVDIKKQISSTCDPLTKNTNCLVTIITNLLEKLKYEDKPEVNRSDIQEELIQSQISVDGQRQCPICFERAYKTLKLLPCCHAFCVPCLKVHLRYKLSCHNHYKAFRRCIPCRYHNLLFIP